MTNPTESKPHVEAPVPFFPPEGFSGVLLNGKYIDGPREPGKRCLVGNNKWGFTPLSSRPHTCRIVPYNAPSEGWKPSGGLPGDPLYSPKRDLTKTPITQLILHRGPEAQSDKWDGGNYSHACVRQLDNRMLSTTFSLDVDGTIYQHTDFSRFYNRHTIHHNEQSISIDICGPWTRSRYEAIGDMKPVDTQFAIGKKGDSGVPLARPWSTVRHWSMTSDQRDALAAFVPWVCALAGIPLRACSEARTMRVGGLGTKDPVTHVKGVLSHCQVAGPGTRVDGMAELLEIKNHPLMASCQWRDSAHFFD